MPRGPPDSLLLLLCKGNARVVLVTVVWGTLSDEDTKPEVKLARDGAPRHTRGPKGRPG